MKFRLAIDSDITQILKVCQDIVHHMVNTLKIEQWDNSYPNREVFLNDIKNKELYVLEDNNIIIGFIVINNQVYDAYNEVNWEESNNFKVFHRIGVNPHFHNKGYGTKLFNFAENKVLELNISHVRIDTFSLNIPMNNLIKKMNYNFNGSMTLKENRPVWNCYEKKIKSNYNKKTT